MKTYQYFQKNVFYMYQNRSPFLLQSQMLFFSSFIIISDMNRIFRRVFAFFIFTLTFSSIIYANETEFEKVFQYVKADD